MIFLYIFKYKYIYTYNDGVILVINKLNAKTKFRFTMRTFRKSNSQIEVEIRIGFYRVIRMTSSWWASEEDPSFVVVVCCHFHDDDITFGVCWCFSLSSHLIKMDRQKKTIDQHWNQPLTNTNKQWHPAATQKLINLNHFVVFFFFSTHFSCIGTAQCNFAIQIFNAGHWNN